MFKTQRKLNSRFFLHSLSTYYSIFKKHLKYEKDLGVDSFCLYFLVYIDRQLKGRFFLYFVFVF